MSELVLFGEEILLSIARGRDFDTNALYYFNTCLLKCGNLSRVIGHEPETRHSQVAQDLDAECVVSQVRFESQVVIRLYRVHASVLKLIGPQLVDQSNAAAFLQLINQYSVAFLRDRLQGEFQLLATITAARLENVSGQALRMDTNQGRIAARGTPHDERQYFVGMVFGFEAKKNAEGSIFC